MVNRVSAIYVRVSTDDQAREGYSIEAQIDKLSAYAKFQGWANVQVFADEGESAKDMNRPQMQKLMRLIKQGQVAVVATVAVDRLSRNLLDMLQFIDLCERHKTAYVCAALNFDTSTPIGRMVLQILAAFAEFERAMIATRVRSTMLEVASKKKRYQSFAPFGYRLDDSKQLVIVPEEAELVRKIADMYIAGHGYRAITKTLNESGSKPRSGGIWHNTSVRRLICNEIYAGQLVYNRRYYDKEGKMQWRDESEWIVRDDAHPAIYTEEQWAAIEKKLQRPKPTGKDRAKKMRVSGLLVCGHCGSGMNARKYGNKKTEVSQRDIFVCRNYAHNGGCWFNYVQNEDAEVAVYQTLERLADGSLTVSDQDLSQAMTSKEAEYVRRESAIDQRFQRQIAAYENGLIGDNDLRLARERIEKERQLLAEEKARAQAPQVEKISAAIQKEAKQALWLWEHGELPVLQNAIRGLIDSVVIRDRQVVDVRIAGDILGIE